MLLSTLSRSLKMSSNQRIAIIGCGSSGLVTAKSLIAEGIHPTIFESSGDLGGIWAKGNQRTWKSLHTNLSKYTCSFSDHAWTEGEPLFPPQHSVHDYLQTFAEKHNIRKLVKFNSLVKRISKTDRGSFTVSWLPAHDQTQLLTEEYDQVVVTSGSFSTPHHDVQELQSRNSRLKLLNSDMYSSPESFRNQVVAIIGGSFSGFEIAADLVKFAKKIYHIIPKHSYAIPKFLPVDATDPATAFIPIDLLFYHLTPEKMTSIHNCYYSSLTTPEPSALSNKNIEVLFKPEAETINTHKYFQRMMGSHIYRASASGTTSDPLFLQFPNEIPQDQALICAELMNQKPFVSISDDYRTALLSSKIQLVYGRVEDINQDQIIVKSSLDGSSSSYTLNQLIAANTGKPSEEIESPEVGITCTGFHPNLSFLDKTLLQTLEYDPSDSFSPFIAFKDMYRQDLPGLYFVGMYRGPYFGIIEQQAKFVSGLISQRISYPSEEDYLRGIESSRQIRAQVSRPQFPHSDYAGYLFDLAKLTNSLPPTFDYVQNNPIVTPFTFSSDPEIRERMAEEIKQVIEDCNNGKNIPKVITSLIEGRKYRFYRTINNKLDGTITSVQGTIRFERIPSMPLDRQAILQLCSSCAVKSSSLPSTMSSSSPLYLSQQKEAPIELDRTFLLYQEDGEILLPNGRKFEVQQHYIYHYNEERNSLEVFFSQRDQKQLIDYHFLSLQFVKDELRRGWVGKSDHLCLQDLYEAEYLVQMNGLEIPKILIEFTVQGPKKDYVSTTVLELF